MRRMTGVSAGKTVSSAPQSTRNVTTIMHTESETLPAVLTARVNAAEKGSGCSADGVLAAHCGRGAHPRKNMPSSPADAS